ncbi:hypothetical protein CBOM_01839 [Ceraceosorus bombacis]|uniref:Uncharacterized protein n=1 Tax=Ceraceosorus bombacis TaxID=401625 RepID=A0A0P1BDU4_9BASI|nr:hypothetical protein CBOM_01839 [Ceraceosorus bombacis]
MAKPRGNKTAPVSRGLLVAFLVLTILTTGFAAVSSVWAWEWSESGEGTWDTSIASFATSISMTIWSIIPGTIIPSLDLDHRLSNKGRLSAWLIHIVVSVFILIAFIGGTAAKAAALNRLEDRYNSYGFPRYYNYRFQNTFQFPFWLVAIVLQVVTLSIACIYLRKFITARKAIEPAKVDGWNELTRRDSTAKSEIDHTQA